MEWIHPMHLRIADMDIHPITEIVAPYVQAIKGVTCLKELQTVTSDHEFFAGDACDAARAMAEADWPAYERFNVVGRDNSYHGDDLRYLMERFGAIMILEQMIHISTVAGHFGVPDGLAVIRMAEQGMIEEINGRAVINLPKGKSE